MVRTLVFLFLGVVALGTTVTPGLAPVGVLLFLFLGAAVIWWMGFAVTTHGSPREALAETTRPSLLGPGGADDPFADQPYGDGEQRRQPTP